MRAGYSLPDNLARQLSQTATTATMSYIVKSYRGRMSIATTNLSQWHYFTGWGADYTPAMYYIDYTDIVREHYRRMQEM